MWFVNEHTALDQAFQSSLECPCACWWYAQEPVVGTVFGVMDEMDLIRTSRWLDRPDLLSPEEVLIKGFDHSILKGTNYWGLSLRVTSVWRERHWLNPRAQSGLAVSDGVHRQPMEDRLSRRGLSGGRSRHRILTINRILTISRAR